jgi:tetratricopeptide (TPR) repeat protein
VATPWAPRAGLVAGWFLITILPVSNLFFPIGVLVAERTLYVPSLAVCLLAGFAWESLAQHARAQTRRLAYALAALTVIAFGTRTVMRNPDWDSQHKVWLGLLRDHPESYRAQWLNAINLWNAGRPDLAEKYFNLAYQIWPRDSQMIAEWGNFYIGQKDWDKAIRLLEQSRDMTPFVPRTHHYLAFAYLHAGRPADAVRTAQHSLTMVGAHPSVVYPVLADALRRLGRFEEAADTWRKAIAGKSGDLWLNWAMLARAQAAAGQTEAAMRSAEIALSRTNAKDERSQAAVRGLKDAIANGCYRQKPDPAGELACDPLVGWQLIVGAAPGRMQ